MHSEDRHTAQTPEQMYTDGEPFIGGELLAEGLTNRELFAALAMQGIIADRKIFDPGIAARNAVVMADALIEELNKEKVDE